VSEKYSTNKKSNQQILGVVTTLSSQFDTVVSGGDPHFSFCPADPVRNKIQKPDQGYNINGRASFQTIGGV